MERLEVYERLRSVVEESATEEIDWASASDATEIASLGFDSLAVLDLLFDLEQEFGIKITAKEIQSVATVGELVTFLLERLQSPAPDAG